MATNEYKSRYSGEQIDEAVGIVFGEITSENSNLLTKDDILDTTGPNQNKVVSQAGITNALNNSGSSITVDDEMSGTSENPVQNKVIAEALSVGLNSKLNATNPSGTGSLSLNRKSNTSVGANSIAVGNQTTASGISSCAEGSDTIASGAYSHAEGNSTTANRRSQHVYGEYNILDTSGSTVSDKGDYIEIAGNGTADNARSNARTLDWSGNEVLAGTSTATGFKTPSGTSSQFLKADGSTDSSTYQPLLTAGENITIENNVISASGGGGGGSTKYLHDVSLTLKNGFIGALGTSTIVINFQIVTETNTAFTLSNLITYIYNYCDNTNREYRGFFSCPVFISSSSSKYMIWIQEVKRYSTSGIYITYTTLTFSNGDVSAGTTSVNLPDYSPTSYYSIFDRVSQI